MPARSARSRAQFSPDIRLLYTRLEGSSKSQYVHLFEGFYVFLESIRDFLLKGRPD